MVVRGDSREPTKNELERLSLGGICLSLIDRTVDYKLALSASHSKRKDKQTTEDYLQKIRPLMSELDRREQCYLAGPNSVIG